ncbi:DUF2937 family protein [Jannaschia aquimarina]|uniref:DUF2937 family protein n=1 Tax=Jannaschia aquimarina TaxID=935700 RepID=A0A0D1EJ79_9RHOB|nr:DUF2937 family protein [Jannaschia aquimarina]KIT17036.1 hypothetical protein jaqu_12260 [Jannaschia aquimarina]SNS81981.1 Protein of unknown function [Jannaschia aquimarina]
MIGRLAGVVLAVFVGGTASQAPEFAQQYQQRLGGAVDELSRIVADFDRDAYEAGLTRQDALAAMTGSEFVLRRQASMRRNIDRLGRMGAQIDRLRAEPTGLGRVALVARAPDPELARRTWDDFQPAIPITPTGFGLGATGAFLGWLLAQLLRMPFRRRTSQPARSSL